MTVNLPYTDAHLLCDLFPVQKTEILQPQDLVILRVVHILQDHCSHRVDLVPLKRGSAMVDPIATDTPTEAVSPC